MPAQRGRYNLVLLLMAGLAVSRFTTVQFHSHVKLKATINNEDKAYVVLSTGSSPIYSFFVPLAALVWSRRQRLQPIILLVQDTPRATGWAGDPQAAVIQKHLKLWGFQDSVYLLGYNTSLPDNNVAISQVTRAYVSGLCGLAGPVGAAIQEDAYIMTTDVDIIPVSNASYFLPEKPTSVGKITNAMCCQANMQTQGMAHREYPMSTVAMRARLWQESFGYQCICKGNDADRCLSADLPRHVNQVLTTTFGYESRGFQWNMDQRLLSWRLHQHAALHSNLELVSRNTDLDRIDRGNWPEGAWSEDRLASFVDAHVLRPGYVEGNWQRLGPVYKQAMLINDSDEDDLRLWDQVVGYVDQYRAALKLAPPLQAYQVVPDNRKG